MRLFPVSLVVLLLAAALPLAAQDAAPAPRPEPRFTLPDNPNIGTLPLIVSSDQYQEVLVARNDNGDGSTMDNQYQVAAQTYLIATDASGVNIWSGDPNDSNTNAVSNNATTTSIPETLVTEVSNNDNILLTHTISHVDGTQLLQHTWVISNQNANHATYTNVQLRYGGDIAYTGNTQGVGMYDSASQRLYLSVPTSPGLMTYYADASSPFSHYYEDADVEAALNDPKSPLPDTTNATFQDSAGMGAEWDIGNLDYNKPVTIIMYEAWDTPGFVTVTPPDQLAAVTGTASDVVFSIENDEAGSDTFALDYNAGPGMNVIGPSSITIQPLTSAIVHMTLVPTAAGIPESSVSLLATSTTTPAYFSQGMMLVEQAASALSGPASLQLPPATQVSVPASIQSLETAATDTFSISVAATTGVSLVSATMPNGVILSALHGPITRAVTVVPLTGPVSVTLAPGGIDNFTIQCTVASDAAMPAAITLTAESQSATSPVASVFTIPITIAASGGGPTNVTLPAPGLAVSSAGQVVFYPLCPATTNGVTSLTAFLNATAPTDAVGFCWDATTQAYVEYPVLPTGGIQPTTGIFVATAVPLDADFSGAPSATSATIALQPGWNLVGVPPISTGGLTVTSVLFPGDFSLAVGGVGVTSAAVFANDIGIASSDQPSTAEPYFYNGTAYAQVGQLDAGTAYWFHNNLNAVATLTVTPGTLSTLSGVHAQPRATSGASPPPAPTQAPAASMGAAASGRCGAAAGVVMLISLALWRRRRRG